jgi:hypothetical protein
MNETIIKAVVENGVVTNIIVVADEGLSEWDGKQLLDLPPGGGIGWRLVDGELIDLRESAP